MLNHTQVEELLPGYILGALEPPEQEALLRHILSCGACFRLAEAQMEISAGLAGGIPEAEAPASLRDRVLATIARRPMYLANSAAKALYWPRYGTGRQK